MAWTYKATEGQYVTCGGGHRFVMLALAVGLYDEWVADPEAVPRCPACGRAATQAEEAGVRVLVVGVDGEGAP